MTQPMMQIFQDLITFFGQKIRTYSVLSSLSNSLSNRRYTNRKKQSIRFRVSSTLTMIQKNLLLLNNIFKSKCPGCLSLQLFLLDVLLGIQVLNLTFFMQIQEEYVSSSKRFDKPIFEQNAEQPSQTNSEYVDMFVLFLALFHTFSFFSVTGFVLFLFYPRCIQPIVVRSDCIIFVLTYVNVHLD